MEFVKQELTYAGKLAATSVIFVLFYLLIGKPYLDMPLYLFYLLAGLIGATIMKLTENRKMFKEDD